MTAQELVLIDTFATAYHEAGHAVAMVLTHRGIRAAWIEPYPRRAGRAGMCEATPRPWPKRPSKRRCEDAIIANLAGPVAESIYFKLPLDYRETRIFGASNDLIDSQIIHAYHREHELPLAGLWGRTVKLITSAWPAVEAVAGELIDAEGPVPGKVIRRMVKRALAGGEVQP